MLKQSYFLIMITVADVLSIRQLTATSWRMERTMFCLVHTRLRYCM